MSKHQRYNLANVLHNACMIDGSKTTVLAGIEVMVNSFRKYVLDKDISKLKISTIISIEELGLVTK